jgi:glutathione S-transferase
MKDGPMITLYHCDGARSFRPLWMLEELGLAYELKMLPFPPRVFAKDYLALNPLGTIPLMIDGDTGMTESSGICHYLGIKYGPTPLMVSPDEGAYGAFLNWMYFSDATLTFPQTLVLRYSQLEPEERRNPQVATDYAKWFLGRLRAVEAFHGGRHRHRLRAAAGRHDRARQGFRPERRGLLGPAAAARGVSAGGGGRTPRRGGAECRAACAGLRWLVP